MDLDLLCQFAAIAAEKKSGFSALAPGGGTSSKFISNLWLAFKWPLLIFVVIAILRGGGSALWRAIWNSLK